MRLTSQSELTNRTTGKEAGDGRSPEASAAPASLFPGLCGPHYATESAYKAAQYELRGRGLVKALARPVPAAGGGEAVSHFSSHRTNPTHTAPHGAPVAQSRSGGRSVQAGSYE